MALFISRQGTTSAAAHQIVTSLAALLYMAPLSLAIATSARVSFWLGAQDPHQAHMVMKQGFLIDWSLAAVVSVIIFFLNPWIAPLFTTHPEVVSAASGVLIWLSLYHLGDATQVMCFFMLRCYKITVMPLLIYCIFLWGVGLMGGYQLAYHGLEALDWPAMPSPKTFWLSNTAAVFAVCVCMLALLNWVSKKSIQER
jgi:MATE family multidrug resistance protein